MGPVHLKLGSSLMERQHQVSNSFNDIPSKSCPYSPLGKISDKKIMNWNNFRIPTKNSNSNTEPVLETRVIQNTYNYALHEAWISKIPFFSGGHPYLVVLFHVKSPCLNPMNLSLWDAANISDIFVSCPWCATFLLRKKCHHGSNSII